MHTPLLHHGIEQASELVKLGLSDTCLRCSFHPTAFCLLSFLSLSSLLARDDNLDGIMVQDVGA